jgi:hypothetical protein
MIAPLQHFSPDRQPDDEKDQAHHQEKEKEEFSDSRGGRSNAGKSKQRSYQSDDQEDYSPT